MVKELSVKIFPLVTICAEASEPDISKRLFVGLVIAQNSASFAVLVDVVVIAPSVTAETVTSLPLGLAADGAEMLIPVLLPTE